MKKLPIIIVLSIGLFFFSAPAALAASLYLSPSGGTIGASTSIQIRLNAGGDAINGVSAYLTYPTDKLEAIGISYGGSFSIAAEGGYGGGFVNISRASFSGVTGDVNVATVRFRAKTAGSATISFRGGSAAARASDSSNALGGSSGGTYTLAPGQGGTTTTSATSKTTPTPSAPPDGSAPVISDVTVSNVATNSATVTWKTDDASDATVEFGLEDGQYFLSKTDSTLTTNHSIKLESPLFQPGLAIHFLVRSKNASGKEAVSTDTTVQLKGYRIVVRVVDNLNTPIPLATVLLYSTPRKTTTNTDGEATFENVTPGKHVVFVKLGDNATISEITVSEMEKTQTLTVKTNTLSPTDALLAQVNPITIGGSLTLVALGIGVAIFLKRKHKVVLPQAPITS